MSALEACRSRRDEAFACGFCLEYKFVSSADAYRQESDYKRGETTYLAYDTLWRPACSNLAFSWHTT
jgi:hypothetical protein